MRYYCIDAECSWCCRLHQLSQQESSFFRPIRNKFVNSLGSGYVGIVVWLSANRIEVRRTGTEFMGYSRRSGSAKAQFYSIKIWLHCPKVRSPLGWSLALFLRCFLPSHCPVPLIIDPEPLRAAVATATEWKLSVLNHVHEVLMDGPKKLSNMQTREPVLTLTTR